MALDDSVSTISASSSSSTSSPNTPIDAVMKLLRAKTDPERLAGLLLVTKLCDPNDQNVILDVYRAIGSTFIHRLLLTGVGKLDGGDGGHDDNRDAYFGLAVAVLATFARIPEVASTEEMLSNVPLIVEALSKESIPSIFEDCYEFLYLVSNAKMVGVEALYDSGMMRVLAHQMPTLSDDSRAMELGLKLIQLIVIKMPGERVYADHLYDLSNMVPIIAKQFAILHNALKFDALHLLSAIFSSNYSGSLHEILRSRVSEDWPTYARIGIVDVLQNRVGHAERLEALHVAEAAISIVGEDWLLGKTILPDALRSFPVDRCILLVLESSRVEIAVLLNELAYCKYGASPPNCEEFPVKLKNLGVAMSLVEKIIKCLSIFGEDEELNTIIGESTSIMIIKGLDETIGVVLDYLQDAKDHGMRRGDDLLASVRIVGSYLAEAPSACEEKVKQLLGYMLTVEGQDQSGASYCISFLLPMMVQITMNDDGCRIFASAGGFEAVSVYLISLIGSKGSSTEDSSTINLACDTILNFLLKRTKYTFSLDGSFLIKLLQVLTHWADNSMERTVVMMASSICSLILESTSEDALLGHSDFKIDDLHILSRLMKRCLLHVGQDPISHDSTSEDDLYDIVASGFSSWSERFPHIKEAVER